MAPLAASQALLGALPTDALVVDEAPATMGHVRALHRADRAGRYFFNRGAGLGWGMPAALGISLGRGHEPVLCIVDDGSAIHSPQALWTAAHERLPVVFAVIDNREYGILKRSEQALDRLAGLQASAVGLDLADPPIDYTALARSMGVSATRVVRPSDVADQLRAAWRSGTPHLLELPVGGDDGEPRLT
jgi:benzoylformate decarboxylase